MQSKEQNKRPKKGQKNNGPKIKPIDNNGSIAIKFTIDGQLDKFNPIHRGKFDNEMVLARASSGRQPVANKNRTKFV